ncbi:hypothetical protein VN97_g8506 [Penicillium thymicola]|uniref:Uncharacterized protein n=1 Tax=Penicillium thymicola TaxID=293382 RepID=A0AAI9TDM7_PENTH|nr:hypothetical protein VN97_g8506 [Penicillium thymicola]
MLGVRSGLTICSLHRIASISDLERRKKIGSFSLIERVILSAGAMLIFSVYFHLTICPEGRKDFLKVQYNTHFMAELYRPLY